jgi:hypothetical protein
MKEAFEQCSSNSEVKRKKEDRVKGSRLTRLIKDEVRGQWSQAKSVTQGKWLIWKRESEGDGQLPAGRRNLFGK